MILACGRIRRRSTLTGELTSVVFEYPHRDDCVHVVVAVASRFDDSPHGNSASPFSFIPFSCGPRRCIGSNFAMLESHLILARMFYDFSFEVTDEVVKARVGVVRRPKGGLHVKVTARR